MRKRTREAENKYWIDLAKALEIEYIPSSNLKNNGQYRLIGTINGFLTVVNYGSIQQPIYSIVVRFSNLLDPETVKKNLLERPEIKEIKGKLKSQKGSFEVKENYAWIMIPYNYKKDTVTEISKKIDIFVDSLSMYTKPLPRSICEVENCRFRLESEPNLVFVNGFPQILCENCVSEIPNAARKIQEEFHKAPARLSRGIVAGVGIAFLGSILWAIVAVFLDRIAAVLAALMLAGIIITMDKIGTKRTIWSILSAALISVGGVIFGTYLSIILYTIKEYSVEVSVELLFKGWQYLWLNQDILFLPLFFCFLGVVPFLWVVWAGTRRSLSLVFNPKVEVVKKSF